MKRLFIISAVVLGFVPLAHAATTQQPTIELEKKIAYQQGQFGALYAHCGNDKEQTVIGGSIAKWKTETFDGYQGNTQERAALEHEFDDAVNAVTADAGSCKDWIIQASATYRSVAMLSHFGLPTQTVTR